MSASSDTPVPLDGPRLAGPKDAAACVAFFQRYLNPEEVFSPEFLCPLGVRAAVQRREVIIFLAVNELAAALRFYRRKRSECISIYQFAVHPTWRGRLLSRLLIDAAPPGTRLSSCSPRSSLNDYYRNTGWRLRRCTPTEHEWILTGATDGGVNRTVGCFSPCRGHL